MWIAGIDEAGRGCICGGLFVAGVVGLESSIKTIGAKDSKALSPKRREQIYDKILECAKNGDLAYHIACIEAHEIDKLGLSLAMKSGIEAVLEGLSAFIIARNIAESSVDSALHTAHNDLFSQHTAHLSQSTQNAIQSNTALQSVAHNAKNLAHKASPNVSLATQNAQTSQNNSPLISQSTSQTKRTSHNATKLESNAFRIIMDGNATFNATMPEALSARGVVLQTQIKGDSLYPSVSCASILAKVSKDRQMLALDKLYPHYNLAKNKGYGTLEHRQSIAKYGLSAAHRKSFQVSLNLF